jgi:phosphate transport system permease protein
VSPGVDRLFIAAARVCAAAVVAIAPLVLIALAAATVAALVKGVAKPADTAFWLLLSSVSFGLIGATIGTALGVGAALYAVEIASPGLRQTIKALVGALHAVPAVGYGVVAAGALLVTPLLPNLAVTIAIASMVIALMVASVVFVQTRRELSGLPAELRVAAAAAGADPVNTATRAVLPALQRKIAGIWWSSLALALGEATALQIVFAAASIKAEAFGMPVLAGTLASTLLQFGASTRSLALLGTAPLALLLLAMTIAAVLLGRRAVGHVPWP